MTRRLLPSGVIVEVERRPNDFRVALIHPDRTAEWEISEDEAGALMDGLMIEYVQ